MLTRMSLSASAETRAAANPPASTPTSHPTIPPSPVASVTAVEQAATSGPLVKLQRTATTISPATAAVQAPQPTAAGLTTAAQHTPVTDPATAAAPEPHEGTAPAAAALVSSQRNTPAAVTTTSDVQHSSGLGCEGGDLVSADKKQQADAGTTAVGQANRGAEQPGKPVDSSLTSPGSFSA